MYEVLNLTIWSKIKAFIPHSSDVISTFLRYYAALSCNSLPNIWDNLLVPYSRVRNPKEKTEND